MAPALLSNRKSCLPIKGPYAREKANHNQSAAEIAEYSIRDNEANEQDKRR